MFQRHFSMFDDPFFNTPNDIESTFNNLESFMNRPMIDIKRPAVKRSSSNDNQISLRNDSFNHIFDDFEKHIMGMNDMFNKCHTSFDTNFNLSDPNGAFYSSSSVYAYQSDANSSEPRIYQAHKSIKQGPGGLREEQRAERDSRRAEEKMAIGRYIGNRGREIERKRNMKTGQNEENVNFRGLDESEAERFNEEWNNLAGRRLNNSERMGNAHQLKGDSHSRQHMKDKDYNKSDNHRHLAITEGKSRLRKRH